MIERHTTTLETSKRLKASGFPQETAFRWFKRRNQSTPTFSYHVDWWQMNYDSKEECSAPILTEILEKLPAHTVVQKWPNGFEAGHGGKYIRGHSSEEVTALLWLALYEKKEQVL